jgi:hypothetical protein
VSLWKGTTSSADSLERFLKVAYSDDGEYIASEFARSFGIRRYDDDFREAMFFDKPLTSVEHLPSTISYATIIIPRFVAVVRPGLEAGFNVAILLYDFAYDGSRRHCDDGTNRFTFIGTVRYG